MKHILPITLAFSLLSTAIATTFSPTTEKEIEKTIEKTHQFFSTTSVTSVSMTHTIPPHTAEELKDIERRQEICQRTLDMPARDFFLGLPLHEVIESPNTKKIEKEEEDRKMDKSKIHLLSRVIPVFEQILDADVATTDHETTSDKPEVSLFEKPTKHEAK